MVKRAELVQSQLTVAVVALRTFFADENFRTLPRAEKLLTKPTVMAQLVMGEEN